jgi:hypothetical protein
MAIQHTSEIKKIDVIQLNDEMPNVIKRVIWEMTFTDPEISTEINSKAIACAVLDTPSIEDFTDIKNLTDDQILNWAYSVHGGVENYIPMLTPIHTEELQRKAECLGIQEYDRKLQKIVESTNEYDGIF